MGSRGKLITKGKGTILGADIYELPNDDSQPFAPYWNRGTGKVHPRLPADAWSIAHYNAKGLTLGNPPSNNTVSRPEAQPALEDSILELLQSMQAEIKDLKLKLAIKNDEALEEPVQLELL